MPKSTRTPREQLERALHVSFKLPAEAAAMLDAHEQQACITAADRQRAIAARLPEHLAAVVPLLNALADVIDPRCREWFQPARVRDAATDLLAARTGQEASPAADGQVVTCPCRERGQDGDGWVRYQGRDGEFVTLRCRDHEAAAR